MTNNYEANFHRDAVWKGNDLIFKRRKVASIEPDSKYAGMWRVRLPDGHLTDMVNISRAKDWRRDGDAWILVAGRRRFGRVVPDAQFSGMWRSVKSGGQLSDMANLSWVKNAVLIAAERELEWEGRQRCAITPSKSQQIAPVFESRSSPMRFSVSGVST